MSKIKRYFIKYDGELHEVEHKNGAWIKHSDHIASIEEKEKEIAGLRELLTCHSDDVISNCYQKIKSLEAKLALAVKALDVIADRSSKANPGSCDYGCDSPLIAQEALAKIRTP